MKTIFQSYLVLLALLNALRTGEAAEAGKEAADDLTYLHDLARDVVETSRVKPGQKVGSSPANSCGFSVIMPGGRGSYPAFWIRDFAMSLDSGFIASDEIRNHLWLAARCQNGASPRSLKRGLIIPPYAIPDHINLDGGAVFYPGTYASGDDQGSGAYGFLPPVDDHYEFVHMAYCLFRATGRVGFLREIIDRMPLIDRLKNAFSAPSTDPHTGLVVTDDTRRAVGFGFCDAVYLTGQLLFPSLLRYRAAGQLAELCQAIGEAAQAREYRQIQTQIRDHLGPAFAEPTRLRGWLMAATHLGKQPDVWGTAYALHLGVLRGTDEDRARAALVDGVRRRTVIYEGAIRHVPTDFDASLTSAWERTAGVARNTYQNGAYWHTPTGWVIQALRQQDPQLAAQVFTEYVQHLRRSDYRLGPGHEAPWECFNLGYAQNGIYMTSVTLPWAILSPKASPQQP